MVSSSSYFFSRLVKIIEYGMWYRTLPYYEQLYMNEKLFANGKNPVK